MFSQIYKITFIKVNFSNIIAFTNVNGVGYVHFVKSLHAYCRKIATRFVIFAKDQKNKYAMTLSELLHSVSFDDLIPTLKEVYDVETDIYAYREAFDELNLLRPIGRDDGIIKVYRDEEEHYIGVSGCNDIWENLLDLNIHVEEGIRLDDNALAAYILWELTFYGFSQEEQSSFIENLGRPDNKYSKRASEGRTRHLQYPVRTNVHYLPENFSEVEMMKVAISRGDAELYEDLKVFSKKLSEIQNYDKVVVWHAEDADSRLLFCTVASVVRQALYEIDITPEDRRTRWVQAIEDEPETERDVDVFYVGHAGCDITRSSYSMKPVTEKREASDRMEAMGRGRCSGLPGFGQPVWEIIPHVSYIFVRGHF